ncbi:hypothetical protein [Staphylococcus phage SpP]
MQILVNSKNEILSFAIVGGFENGIEVDTIPENFIATFKPLKYRYENKQIFLSESYLEEINVPDNPPIADNSIGTDEELRKMFATMQVQLVQANLMVAELSQQNSDLAQEVVKINEEIKNIKEGDNNGDVIS